MQRGLRDLFGSMARVKILARLLLHTRTEYYQREIVLLEKLAPRAVQRELTRLCHVGLLSSRLRGRRRYYRVNPGHLFYPALKSLFLRSELLGKVSAKGPGVWKDKMDAAFVFGSFAKGDEGPDSDLDLLVIGSIDEEALSELLDRSGFRREREINPVLYTRSGFRKELDRKEPFLMRVLSGPKIFLVGDEEVLGGLGQGSKA
jgi:predicted nucleotidyltransferase